MEISIITLSDLKKQGYSVVELLDSKDNTVGAIYLRTIDLDRIMLTKTNTTEKYFLYTPGIGVYFSNYRVAK